MSLPPELSGPPPRVPRQPRQPGLPRSRPLARLGIAAAPAMLLAACAGAPEPAGSAAVDDSFARARGTWSSGGALLVAAGLREADRRVAVCGAWTTTPQSVLSARHNSDIMAAGSVAVGFERLVNGLAFMTPLGEGAALEGAEARCVATDKPWDASIAVVRPEVFLPRQKFEYDELLGALAVFRQDR